MSFNLKNETDEKIFLSTLKSIFGVIGNDDEKFILFSAQLFPQRVTHSRAFFSCFLIMITSTNVRTDNE